MMMALRSFRKKNWMFSVVFQLLAMAILVSTLTPAKLLKDKCLGRNDKKFPVPGRCKKYLKCSNAGTSKLTLCTENMNYNWITRSCENETESNSCEANKNVQYQGWELKEGEETVLSKGQELQSPLLWSETLANFSFPPKLATRSRIGALLRTYFLAVDDGLFNFTSDCNDWCKLWISKDRCHDGELVLHQNIKRDQNGGVQYSVNKPYKMKFGTFYYLKVLHIVNASKEARNLAIGVQWNDTKMGWKNFSSIATLLLRFNVTQNCSWSRSPIQPSNGGVSSTLPSTSSRSTSVASLSFASSLLASSAFPSSSATSTNLPPTTGGISSTTTMLTSSLSPTGSLSTGVQLSTAKLSTTPSTILTTVTSHVDSKVENLTKIVNDFLDPVSLNRSKNSSDDSVTSVADGLELVREVDRKGDEIAKEWNQKGQSVNVSVPNVVMEVSFPISNYTFPRPTSQDDRYSDQIFIPASALANGSGAFERKVFSALYVNLHKKFPRFFNEVETENENHITGVYQLNSRVIASTAVPRIPSLQQHDIVINLAHLNTNFTSETQFLCVFYKWRKSKKVSGIWSTEGCVRDEKMSTKNMSVCRCNHLTHFGVLMQIKDMKISAANTQALEMISYIGCALSLLGAVLTTLAIVCLPGARSDRNFIHVNLALAIGFAQVIFLAGIDETGNKTLCTVIAALLHYFLLAAFSWMLIEGIFLHILIVKVFHDQLPKKRYYFTFCWGLPAVVVLLSANLLRDEYVAETSCWLSTEKLTIWTFSGPAIMVITINIVILCKIMKEISSLRTSGRRESHIRTIRDGIRSTIILLPLLGITWALGLICVNGSPITFQYLFAIFNSLQGLFIFLFHCVFNSEVRKAFWRKVDLWFTKHNNALGSNGQSRSSFKRSKDDNSFTSPALTLYQDKVLNGVSQRNGFSEKSVNEQNDASRRKLSSITATSFADSWSPRRSLDTQNVLNRYSGKLSSTLQANINDIKHHPRLIYQDDTDVKKPTLEMESTQSTEDPNSNITSSHGETANNKREETKQQSSEDQLNHTDVAVGIGGQRMSSVRKMAQKLDKHKALRNVRQIAVSNNAESKVPNNKDIINNESTTTYKSKNETKL